MVNAYTIKYNKKLLFYISKNHTESLINKRSIRFDRLAIILYLYYIEDLEKYCKYIELLPKEADIYVISSADSVIKAVEEKEKKIFHKGIKCILKPNQGRDVSALLVTSQNIVKQHDYICFVHDKKEHSPEKHDDNELWVKNIWGNLLGDEGYIGKIVGIFKKNSNIGVLAPPDPIGDYFYSWYGYGWHGSFEVTRKLAEKLGLRADLDQHYPPITLGTALWFRTEALKKLFDFGWKYDDFDDDRLRNPDYISYGIERIFAYAAQDAGYDTGEVMSSEYAVEQNLILKEKTSEILLAMHDFFPFPCAAQARDVQDKLDCMMEYLRGKEKVYLYGCGDVGRFCAGYLRREGIEPIAFLVTDQPKLDMVDGIKVVCVDTVEIESDVGIVISVIMDKSRDEIRKKLEEKKCDDYYVF